MPRLVAENVTSEKFSEMTDKNANVADLESGSTMANMARTANIPVTVDFSGINYSIKTGKGEKSKTKLILNNLSGKLEPGTMTAIMGPTGSGKTSLLNVLANRMPVTKGAELRGSLLVNRGAVNDPLWARRFGRLSAYVMQEDAMNAFLTVRETLGLAAAFQLPPSVTAEERGQLVNATIAELGLNKVADTVVGDAKHRGVSGGEKKRANIGIELIKNPSALFLDEPTSGLDSFQAQSVMTCMARLAQAAGRTVCASIHQPRSSIFALFDQLYLISEGQCMYSGKASLAVDYFTRVDPSYACPPQFNPADWFLDLTSADYRSETAETTTLARLKLLDGAWRDRHTRHDPSWSVDNDLAELAVVGGGGEEGKEGHFDQEGSSSSSSSSSTSAAAAAAAAVVSSPSPSSSTHRGGGDGSTSPSEEAEPLPTYQSSTWRQTELVMWRSGVAVLRNRGALLSKILPSLFFAFIIGAIYSDTGNDQKSIQDKIGALFFFTINQTFGNLLAVVITFSAEKIVVERERASRSYRLSSFYLGKNFAELPLNLVSPLVFGCVVYWLVGLNDSPGRFFTFLVILLLIGFAAIGLGMLIAAATPNQDAAQAAAPIVVVLMILFGGFYINVDSLPDALAWIQYLSIMRWAFMGLAVNQFKGETFSCKDVDVEAGDTCVRTGDETIRRLSFGGETAYQAMGALLALMVAFNALAYIALRIKKKKYQAIKAP